MSLFDCQTPEQGHASVAISAPALSTGICSIELYKVRAGTWAFQKAEEEEVET